MCLNFVKDSKQYRRLSKDRKEKVWALDEATEVKQEEEPGSNWHPTKGTSLGS
jgi:hypothetical protein